MLASAGLGFRITPHALRHVHVSWLLAAGADLQVVTSWRRVGHVVSLTQATYVTEVWCTSWGD
jgi:site-specific recombinase XerD